MIDHLAPLVFFLSSEVWIMNSCLRSLMLGPPAKINELKDLKERNAALEGRVVALESATASKDAELASSNS
uniref:Uncharacterized protein n=1 Tax=Tanacetum cinerariifolium TaxID=118510 RepID=A0A699UCJ8_TANCI|nr:hypothetical protein [Tanacetum cinerariifolium]